MQDTQIRRRKSTLHSTPTMTLENSLAAYCLCPPQYALEFSDSNIRDNGSLLSAFLPRRRVIVHFDEGVSKLHFQNCKFPSRGEVVLGRCGLKVVDCVPSPSELYGRTPLFVRLLIIAHRAGRCKNGEGAVGAPSRFTRVTTNASRLGGSFPEIGVCLPTCRTNKGTGGEGHR